MPNKNTIEIRLEVKDDGSVTIKKFAGEASDSFGKVKDGQNALERSTRSLTEQVIKLGAAYLGIRGITALAKSFMEAASTSEEYRTRLVALVGSAAEAEKTFKAMNEYAARTPFELQEIMGAATALAGIMKGGSQQIASWMPLIGDLAATTGLSIDLATQQVMRMLSAGAASADLFRERGVLAMLGFQAGVTYSAQETEKKLVEAWTRADSQFRGSTEKLAATWKGTMSMFSDEWFQFRNMVMDNDTFGSLKGAASEFLGVLKQFERDGTLKAWADAISGTLGYVTRLVQDAIGYWTEFFNIGYAAQLRKVQQQIYETEREIAAGGKTSMLGDIPVFTSVDELRRKLAALIQQERDLLAATQAVKTAAATGPAGPVGLGLISQADVKTAEDYAKWLEKVGGSVGLALQAEADLNTQRLAQLRELREAQDAADKQMREGDERAGSYLKAHYGEYVDASVNELQRLEMAVRQVGSHFTDTIVEMTMSGKASFKEMIDAMISDLLRFMIQTKVTEPFFSLVGGLIGGLGTPSYPAPVPGVYDAHGDAWMNGRIVAYGRGDVVFRPTIFPMAQGWGLMGEAGPEGILPLKRTSSGDLGVQAAGGGGQTVVNNYINVSALDGDSVAKLFLRHSGALASAHSKELRMGNRELLGTMRSTI